MRFRGLEVYSCRGVLYIDTVFIMETVNIEFVGEVEKHPELYDYTNAYYSRKDVTKQAWTEIGRKFNLTANESKEKWRNLRNAFVKNMKPSAGDDSFRKRKAYYLSEAMKFALPFVKVLSAASGSLPEMPEPDHNVLEIFLNEDSTIREESETVLPPLPSPSPTLSQAVLTGSDDLWETKTENGQTECNGDNKEAETETVSKYRRALPQFLATSAKNLILLDLGMTLAFPTIVIPALLKAHGPLSFDDTLASWFGSIAFICQPIGSVISGTLLEPLGRKRSMLLVNIPHLLGWYLFYAAISVPALFIAAIMMGLGVGFMEAPVITYVGEISEPSLRGILTSYSGIFVTIGLIVEFLLGTLCDWNTAALVSSIVPIITIIAISQVPETPMWLLSKGRVKDAEESLRWLRGWVSAAAVQKELNELIRYSDASKLILKDKVPKVDSNENKLRAVYTNSISLEDEKTKSSPDVVKCANENPTVDREETGCSKQVILESAPTEHSALNQRKPTVMELIRDMLRPQMMRPLALVIAFFVFHNGSGFPAIRPYMVNVFEELRFPVDAHWCTVIISIVGFLGVIVCTVFVRIVGKRALAIASLTGCATSMLSLSVWSLINLEHGETSLCWTPFLLFIMLSFSFSFGIAPIPWMILSEVFPFRGRGFASGLAAAISYIMGFITSKTFLDLKLYLGLSGVFCFYGSVTVIGILYVYFKLPETEGRSLEDIENLYKTKSKPIKK